MPSFGILIFLILASLISIYTIRYIWLYIKTRNSTNLKKLGAIWFLPGILIGLAMYAHYPITKDRIVGVYEIDTNFYPGKNANWQKEHFFFEITEDDTFLFPLLCMEK